MGKEEICEQIFTTVIEHLTAHHPEKMANIAKHGPGIYEYIVQYMAKKYPNIFLKKIPLSGFIFSLFHGAKRLYQCDFKGAVGELASGAVSNIPGIGTAASFAIDMGLILYDLMPLILELIE